MSCGNGTSTTAGANDWGSIQLERRRASKFQGFIWRADRDTGEELGADDELQFDLFRDDGDTPILQVVSGANTPGGSTISIVDRTAPAEFELLIGQADAATLPLQTLSGELAINDPNEPANQLWSVAHGEVAVVRTAALVP